MRFSTFNHAAKAFVSRFVHAGIRPGTGEFERHRRFLTASALACGLGLGMVPLLIAGNQASPHLWAAAAGVAAVPFLLAVAVSRGGRLDFALNISALFVAVSLGVGLAATGSTTGAPAVPVILVAALGCLEPAFWRMRRPVSKGLAMAIIGGSTMAVWSASGTPIPELRHPDTSMSVILWAAAAAYFLFCLGRIAERRGSSREGAGSDAERLDILQANTRELITVHNRDGSAQSVTPSSRTLIGAEPAELQGTGFSSKIHLQDRILFLKAVSDVWHSRAEKTLRLRLRNKGRGDRSWIRVEMVLRARVSKNGAVASVVACSRDITDEFEREVEFRQAREKRDRDDAAQKRFLATMSHELRTPLNAIIGFAGMLEQELFGRLEQERHREYVSHIHSSGQHLLNVVNDMLDMSRIEAGRYELDITEFRLNEVVDTTLGMMLPLAEEAKVTVMGNVGENLPSIRGDRRSWQQILINLVSNAIKFTPEGGTVNLAVRAFGRSIKLIVRDTGIGIDPEFLKSIGEPFMQAEAGPDRRFGGTGLGLSVVKGLVELCGGDFQIESVPGKGTTATVIMPMQTVAPRAKPHTENTEIVDLAKGKTGTKANERSDSSVASKGASHARLSA